VFEAHPDQELILHRIAEPTGSGSEKGRHIMLGLIVSLLVIGLIAGAVARLVVPGKQNLSIIATIVIGIVGSLSADSLVT